VRKFHLSGKEICLGRHPKVGFFIYDKAQQTGVPGELVRIFVVAKGELSIFLKDIIYGDSSAVDRVPDTDIAPIIWTYFEYVWNRGRRKTLDTAKTNNAKCIRCQAHVTRMGVLECKTCGWIRVECGACACLSKSFCDCERIAGKKSRAVTGVANKLDAA
jgi:hypothetical protein